MKVKTVQQLTVLIPVLILLASCAPAESGESLRVVSGTMKTIQLHQASIDSLITGQYKMSPSEFAKREKLLRRRIARMGEALYIQAQPEEK